MSKYKIAWLPGDGIGVEVCEATRICLDKLQFDAEYLYGDIGWKFWCNEGNPLPDRTIQILKNTDCAFFGAITSKPQDISNEELNPKLKNLGLTYLSPILKIRQMFDLYTLFRPCKAFRNNTLNYKEKIDIVIFAENTEGMYIGIEFPSVPEAMLSLPGMEKIQKDTTIAIGAISRYKSERVIKAAFEYAKKNKIKKVTVITKANVLRITCGLFLETAKDISKEYPEIELESVTIDAICMWLIKDPLSFNIIVTTNMFGDILSDLCSQLIGGLGFARSGSIGNSYALFEPSHGSAPKYAGLYKANPIGAILASKMMLDWIGESKKANLLFQAIQEVITEGKVKTFDMKGTASTLDMAKAIAEKTIN
jgi:3-isopropylmalate dehydrogenase